MRAAAVGAVIAACCLASGGSSAGRRAAPAPFDKPTRATTDSARRAPPRPGPLFLAFLREADRFWRGEDWDAAAQYARAAGRQDPAEPRCERLIALCAAAEKDEEEGKYDAFNSEWDEIVAAWGFPEPFHGCALPLPPERLKEYLARDREERRRRRIPDLLLEADLAFHRGEYATAREFCRHALLLGAASAVTQQLIDLASEFEHDVKGFGRRKPDEEWRELLDRAEEASANQR